MVNDDDDENTCEYAKSGVIISSVNEPDAVVGCWQGGVISEPTLRLAWEFVPTWDTREDRQTGRERDDENIHPFLFWGFRERKMKRRQN